MAQKPKNSIWAVAKEESQRSKEDPSRSGGLNELREMEEEDDVPGWVRGMMSPLKANLEGVTIEYGLFGGRFWLPRTQYAMAIAQGHCFNDGNKRTAYRAMEVCLEGNGVSPKWDTETVGQIIIRVAQGLMDEVQLAEWLREG
mgnify:CR=1 FL=1